MESRLRKLADTIVNYSLELKEGEKVLITYQTLEPLPLVKYLIETIYQVGGIPYTNIMEHEIAALLLEQTSQKRIELLRSIAKFEVDNYDAFINIRYNVNDYEQVRVKPSILKMIGDNLKDITNIRINERKWVLLDYPSKLDAYKAKMKIDGFIDFALSVMTIDYKQLSVDIQPLKKLMEKTDKVRITGKGTDLTFSIKGIPVVPCVGTRNIPDGEIFTAPIKDSINGYITFNTPSPYQGNVYTNVKLVFVNGNIVEATCNEDNDNLNKIFDTDEGARYIGEFAIGLNPIIKHPMGNILYDEKIVGSIHLTPGRCYKNAFNGNDSNIHWDLVLIQRKEYGGGDIYFDNLLIRKDGIFVLDELKHLNYEVNINKK
ncbi:MAG: aminopeptidase [Bacilli bacterium]|nr:aminopeptidase [Bacilli bacterium]